MIGLKRTWLDGPEGHLRVAIGGAFLTLILKGLSYDSGGGAGLLSDAAESLLNAITAILGLYGVLWAQRPPDPDHPYGHGKVDALIASLQALLVASTAGILAYAILRGSYRPLTPEGLSRVLAYQGAAMLTNAALAGYLWIGYRRHKAQILRTESLHLLGDVVTSLLVIGGFLAVWAGWPSVLDVGVGLVLAGLIGYGAIQILRETGATLIDTQDPKLMRRLAEALERKRRPEWIDIHNVRIQRYGTSLHVDGHVTFPWYWSLRDAHEAMKELEATLRRELRQPVEFFWHMDPCEPVCCKYCRVQGCPYRQSAFEKHLSFTPESLFVNRKGLR